MTESKHLKDKLDELRAELRDSQEIDKDTEATLQKLMGDIAATLEREKHDEGLHLPLAKEAEEMAAEFGAAHPRVAQLLNALATRLSRLGI